MVSPDVLKISAALPQQRSAALDLFLRHLPAAERLVQTADVIASAERGEFDLTGLLLAEHQGEIVGVALCVIQADRSTLVWPPVVVGAAADAAVVADALLQACIKRMRAADAWLGQCLLETDQRAERELMVRNGFPHLTDLIYMQHSVNRPIPSTAGSRWETVCFADVGVESRFARLIEKSYVGTLDCPELEGRRSGEDALVGHRQSGLFLPEQSRLYFREDVDAGLILLADHPEQSLWEVVYMGVAPSSRGQGLGRTMIEEAISAAHRHQRQLLLLAVDSRNHFAQNTYRQVGFEELTTRSVHAWLANR